MALVPIERQVNVATVAARLRQQMGLKDAATKEASEFATAAEGLLATTALQPESPLAAENLTGTIDPARIPVLPGNEHVVSSAGIAALTAEQQAVVLRGSIVTTTDGRRWVYTGSGSKVSEASYIVLADVTPDWSAVSGKPTFGDAATRNIGTTAGTVAAGDDERIVNAMQPAVYDPEGVGANAFDSANQGFTSTAPLAAPRIVRDKLMDMPFVEDWGAVANDSNDHRASIQAAMDAERRVFFRDGTYIVDGALYLPTKQQLHGFGPANTDSLSVSGAPKIRFVGSHETVSCFMNQDPLNPITHGGFFGLSIRCEGDYDYIFDLVETVGWTWEKVAARAIGLNTGGIRSAKLDPANPSWVNRILSSDIHLPDASVKRPLDADWSDTVIETAHLTGGIGSIDRGFGTKYIGCNIERSSGAGLTFKKQTAAKSGIVMGSFIDANKDYGILVDCDDDTFLADNQRFLVINLIGNTFRTINPSSGSGEQGIADIAFRTNTGQVYRGGMICGNSYNTRSALVRYSIPSASFIDYTVMDNEYDYTVGQFNPEVQGGSYSAGPRGVRIPKGPLVARSNRVIRSETSVAGFFGGEDDTGAGIAVGAKSGQPYIAATVDSSGTARDLRVYTGGVHRLSVAADGSWLRAITDLALSLGTSTARFFAGYFGRLYLVDGISAPSTLAGHASIYIDSADGDLKVKFGDGTVKTIITDT